MRSSNIQRAFTMRFNDLQFSYVGIILCNLLSLCVFYLFINLCFYYITSPQCYKRKQKSNKGRKIIKNESFIEIFYPTSSPGLMVRLESRNTAFVNINSLENLETYSTYKMQNIVIRYFIVKLSDNIDIHIFLFINMQWKIM